MQNFVIFLGGHAGSPSTVQNVLHVLYDLVTLLFYDQCTFFQLEIRYWVCAPNMTNVGMMTGYVSESIEGSVEDQAFLRT